MPSYDKKLPKQNKKGLDYSTTLDLAHSSISDFKSYSF